ncbi:filamentous hemagglutinin N-terminal domain-containing protein, partial [Baaleninema sp.]
MTSFQAAGWVRLGLVLLTASLASSPVRAASESQIFPLAQTLSTPSDEVFLAQITPDATLGTEASVVTPNASVNGNPATLIEGGATRGANLFHSFQEFNVNSFESVYFNNPANIQNILSRVTGNNISNIDGVLGVNGSANLFLLNPNGILFGSGASLDISGSFFASTADSLVFENNAEFSATNPASAPLLTVSVPVGVQLGNSPGTIRGTEASLEIRQRETLALLGGTIDLDGVQISAPGGRVLLGGVGGTGTVALQFSNSGSRVSLTGWELPENLDRSPISLTNSASITVIDRIGGEISIDASDITVSSSSLDAGIGEGLGVPDADSGNIELNATGELTLSDSSSIANRVRENSAGNAGDIRVVANVVNVLGSAYLDSNTSGQGNAGNVSLTGDTVNVSEGAFLLSETEGQGNAGNVSLTGDTVNVSEGAYLSSGTEGQGNAGNVTLTGETVNVSEGAYLSSESSGQGNAGNVTLTGETVNVS